MNVIPSFHTLYNFFISNFKKYPYLSGNSVKSTLYESENKWERELIGQYLYIFLYIQNKAKLALAKLI